MHLANHGPPFSKIKNLFKKLAKRGAAFVVDPGIGNETRAEAGFLHPDTELNILRKAIEMKTARHFKDLS